MLRRAGSIVAIHLSGNPGMTGKNKKYLNEKVRTRPAEDIDRFTQIQYNLISFDIT